MVAWFRGVPVEMERNGRIWEAEVTRPLMDWMWSLEREASRLTLRLQPEQLAGGFWGSVYMERKEFGENGEIPRALS